jgi:uncharacterized Tic20 family protein
MTNDERQWGMLSHVIPLGVMFVTGGHGWLAALVIYLAKKDDSKFVAYNALQNLYLQIATVICLIISLILCMVLIGFILIPIVSIGSIIFQVIAAIRANEGVVYELPIVGQMARKTVGI